MPAFDCGFTKKPKHVAGFGQYKIRSENVFLSDFTSVFIFVLHNSMSHLRNETFFIKNKKVSFVLEQAMKTRRGSRGTALLFL